jgi:hypothetical protein
MASFIFYLLATVLVSLLSGKCCHESSALCLVLWLDICIMLLLNSAQGFINLKSGP